MSVRKDQLLVLRIEVHITHCQTRWPQRTQSYPLQGVQHLHYSLGNADDQVSRLKSVVRSFAHYRAIPEPHDRV